MVKIDTTPFTDDEVKEAILKYLHERRSNPRGVDNAKVGIMDLRRALKQKGMEQKQVIRNLLYLLESRWVKEEVEEFQIQTEKRFIPQRIKKYMITNQGMELFDGKSKYSRLDGLAGINIQNVTGVVSIGDNNFIRNESLNLYKNLEELENKIRITDQLNDEQKLNFRAEVKTIESQLSKAHPDRDIIRTSWFVLKGLGVVGSLMTIIERIRPGIEQMIGS